MLGQMSIFDFLPTDIDHTISNLLTTDVDRTISISTDQKSITYEGEYALKQFSYIRELDNYLMKAYISKVGSNQCFYSGYYYYEFFYQFTSQKERDKFYNARLKEMEDTTRECGGKEEIQIQREGILYPCKIKNEQNGSICYASKPYAEHNPRKGKAVSYLC